MLGQRFLPTSYQAKLHQMDYDKHQRRLEEISKTSKSVSEDKDDLFRSTFNDLRNKHQKFQVSEKILSIDKTNQVLLDKLVKISRNQKPPLFKTNTNWPSHPGTLNTGFRKKQLEKIAQENEAMAKRLISQQGSVNRKRLDKDFEKHLEFSKNVQKISSPKIDKLLPIRSPKSIETTKSFKVKRKRVVKKNSASAQIEGNTIEGEPTEEAQSKEYIPTTQTQNEIPQNEAGCPEKAEQTNDNDVTVVSKEADDEAKGIAQVDAEAKGDDEVQPDLKEEAEVEAKSDSKEDAKIEAEEVEEKKDVLNAPDPNGNKSARIQDNKSQASTQRSKRSGTIQPPSNLEKSKLNSTRKASTNNADAKSTTREAAQIPTNRSKTEMEKSQLDKSALKSERKASPTPSQKLNQSQKMQQSQNRSPTPSQSQAPTQRKSPQPEDQSVKDQTVEEIQNQGDVDDKSEEVNQDQVQVSDQRSNKEKEVEVKQEDEQLVDPEQKKEEPVKPTDQQPLASERKEDEPQKGASAEIGKGE